MFLFDLNVLDIIRKIILNSEYKQLWSRSCVQPKTSVLISAKIDLTTPHSWLTGSFEKKKEINHK